MSMTDAEWLRSYFYNTRLEDRDRADTIATRLEQLERENAELKRPALGPNPTVAEIVREYLVKEKYDGLYAPIPQCLEIPYSTCRAGYLQKDGSIGPGKE